MIQKNTLRHWLLRLSRTSLLAGVALGTLANGALAQHRPAPADEPAPEVQAKVNGFISDIQESEAKMEINLLRSKLMRTKQPVSRVSIVDPNVIDVVQFGPQEFEIIGRRTGSTTMTLWFGGAKEQLPVIRYQVTVVRDAQAADQRRVQYGDLQRMVNELFPNSMVYIVPVADKIIIKGEARDSEEAAQILSVIQNRGQMQASNGIFGSSGYVGPTGGYAAVPHPDDLSLPQSTVINLLNVPGEQQVMLKVRIAELSRSSLREMGVNFSARIGDNNFFTSVLAGSSNVTAIFDDSSVSLMLKAFSSNGMSKILAEPNLVTLSGRTASFIAGGEFAVPTVVGVGGVQAASTQFRGFGTQLTFTPTVIDRDRIRLQVSPEFSSLNSKNSVNGIPGLDTRAADTTVDLREGQWLAIAGLLQDTQSGSNGRIPIVGDIPVIRTLFSNKSIQRGETELIVLVSPELVHPIEAEDLPQLLPGMEINEPNDWNFFVRGHVEDWNHCQHRSTIWPQYADQLDDARHGRIIESDSAYVSGPHGFSE
jgi:pilus assembly protein CpaC